MKYNNKKMASIVFVLFFCTFQNIKSQEEWSTVWSSFHGQFNSIYFLDDGQNGWVVGMQAVSSGLEEYYAGYIYHTKDGGKSWIFQTEDIDYALFGVYFTDPNNGFAVGGDVSIGIVLNTNDGGETWVTQYIDNIGQINEVYFTDKQNGWAVGVNGKVIQTSNCGENWLFQESGTLNHLWDVHFADNKHGCAVGDNGTILYTNSGGENWNIKDCGDFPLFGVYFSDAYFGCAVGYFAQVYITNDGGETWDDKWPSYWNRTFLDAYYCVDFVDNQNGWISGQAHRSLIYSSDRGSHWFEKVMLPFSHSFYDMQFIDKQRGWSVDATFDCTYYTPDGGDHWVEQIHRRSDDICSIYFTDSQNGWAVGRDGLILHTNNAGKSWSFQNNYIFPVEGYISNDYVFDVYFTDKNNGWAVCGWDYENNPGMIIHTNNAGETWIIQDSLDYILYKIFFIDNKYGWAVGKNGLMVNTTDGGINWNILDNLPSDIEALKDVQFVNRYNGWIVGVDPSKGYLFHTNNGGQTWSIQWTFSKYSDVSMHFINDQIGWIANQQDYLKVTYDGGFNWSTQKISNTSINDVHFIDKDYGGVVDSHGKIYYTTDGGNSWTKILSGYKGIIGYDRIYFVDKQTAYILGQIDKIFKLTLSQTDVSKNCIVNLPDNFFMMQNYPNPFNTETTIEFFIKEKSNVTLKVFDTTGREVAKLIDCIYPSGVYKKKFNADELPTGIYYYKIYIKDYQEIKKMILLK